MDGVGGLLRGLGGDNQRISDRVACTESLGVAVPTRRLCNQAFFTKVFIDGDNELRVEHNRPFEMLLDPQVNANALTWAADANKARTSASVSVGKGSSLVRGVDLRRFELLTSSMRTRRATNCAIGPYVLNIITRLGPRLHRQDGGTSPTPADIDVVRNVRLWSHPSDAVDLRIAGGMIGAVTPTSDDTAVDTAGNVVNGRGLLALPGLVNAHAHIDKS